MIREYHAFELLELEKIFRQDMKINRICLSFSEAEKLKIISVYHTLTQMLHCLRQYEDQPPMDKFRRCIRSWLSLFEVPIKIRDWKIMVKVGTNQGTTGV